MKNKFTMSLIIIGLLLISFSAIVRSDNIGNDIRIPLSPYTLMSMNTTWYISPEGTISVNYTENEDYSVKFNVHIYFPRRQYYTIGFEINKELINYSDYEGMIILNYSDGMYYYDFNDIHIPHNYDIAYGIHNNHFFFNFSKIFQRGSFDIDPILGYFGMSITKTGLSIQNVMRGEFGFAYTTGYAKYVMALLRSGALAITDQNVKCLIYKVTSSPNAVLMGESEVKIVKVGNRTAKYYQFNFTNPPLIEEGKQYLILAWSSSTTEIMYQIFYPSTYPFYAYAYGNPPYTISHSTDTNKLPLIYAWYDDIIINFSNEFPQNGSTNNTGGCINTSVDVSSNHYPLFLEFNEFTNYTFTIINGSMFYKTFALTLYNETWFKECLNGTSGYGQYGGGWSSISRVYFDMGKEYRVLGFYGRNDWYNDPTELRIAYSTDDSSYTVITQSDFYPIRGWENTKEWVYKKLNNPITMRYFYIRVMNAEYGTGNISLGNNTSPFPILAVDTADINETYGFMTIYADGNYGVENCTLFNGTGSYFWRISPYHNETQEYIFSNNVSQLYTFSNNVSIFDDLGFLFEGVLEFDPVFYLFTLFLMLLYLWYKSESDSMNFLTAIIFIPYSIIFGYYFSVTVATDTLPQWFIMIVYVSLAVIVGGYTIDSHRRKKK